MRTEKEMLELILKVANEDDRVRAVTLNGSRASKTAVRDEFSDFDIVYFVKDIKSFTSNKTWIEVFGEILIVQYSMDWYSHPYDYDSIEPFVSLIQFKDGNRIDLTLVDISQMDKESDNKEPRIVLVNKDNFSQLTTSYDESVYFIKEPTAHEFYNTSNEFRWLSIYITKGLCRHELYYAKYAYDVWVMEMFMKMLNWSIGIKHDFKVTTGSNKKYLKRYLTQEEMDQLTSIFPDGTYDDIWDKLFIMYDLFHENERFVRDHYSFESHDQEISHVRDYLERQKDRIKDED